MHTGDEDGEGNAERHAADDEHGIHSACHARGGESVEHIARRIDGRKSGHEKNGAGDKCIPHCSETEDHRQRPCAERSNEACDHGAGVGVECILCAGAVCDESRECSDGGDECLEPTPAEELA